jgi:hypothetical protein
LLAKPGIRLGRPEGGEHGCLALSHGFHDVGQEVERPDIDRANLVGVMVTQKLRQISHGIGQRAGRVAVRAVEGLARVLVAKVEPACGRRLRQSKRRHQHQHAAAGQEITASQRHQGHGADSFFIAQVGDRPDRL